jgi:hypothetical protein
MFFFLTATTYVKKSIPLRSYIYLGCCCCIKLLLNAAYRRTHVPLTHSSLRFKTVMHYAMKKRVICVASRKFRSLHRHMTERWRDAEACQSLCDSSSSLGLSRTSRNSNVATEIRGRVFSRFTLWEPRVRISARRPAVVRLFHKFLSPFYQTLR